MAHQKRQHIERIGVVGAEPQRNEHKHRQNRDASWRENADKCEGGKDPGTGQHCVEPLADLCHLRRQRDQARQKDSCAGKDGNPHPECVHGKRRGKYRPTHHVKHEADLRRNRERFGDEPVVQPPPLVQRLLIIEFGQAQNGRKIVMPHERIRKIGPIDVKQQRHCGAKHDQKQPQGARQKPAQRDSVDRHDGS